MIFVLTSKYLNWGFIVISAYTLLESNYVVASKDIIFDSVPTNEATYILSRESWSIREYVTIEQAIQYIGFEEFL